MLQNIDKFLYIFGLLRPQLFLRLIRCTNLLAFEHLAKTHDSSKWSDNFQHSVNFFPVGTAADIDFIMQYTLSNSNAVHSMYLAPRPGLSPAQSVNVERSKTYVWVHELLQEIIGDARKELHSKLRDSPLQRKLLLCHKKVYDLLKSITLEPPATHARILPVPSDTDMRSMHKKIICSLMRDEIMYYVDSVERLAQINYKTRLEDSRTTAAMTEIPAPLRAIAAIDNAAPAAPGQPKIKPVVLHKVFQESENQHASRIAQTPIKYTRLTWPLRDLNVYTRISVSQEVRDVQGTRKTYPYYYSYVDCHNWKDDEKETFDFLQEMQTHMENKRAAKDKAFEEGISVNMPPVKVPEKIVQRFSQTTRVAVKLRQLCTTSNAAPTGHATRAQQTELTQQVIQAYRWKAMLIQTTLLSALNGICFEHKTKSLQNFFIHKYTVSGPEYKAADPHRLILQNFVFLPQDVEPQWFMDNPRTVLWQSYRRFNVIRLFRTRQLILQPATLVVPVVNAYDLSKFVFGEQKVVQGKLVQYMWHLPAIDNLIYIMASAGAVEEKVQDKDYSSRIESSEAMKDVRVPLLRMKLISQERNSDWYQYLLAA